MRPPGNLAFGKSAGPQAGAQLPKEFCLDCRRLGNDCLVREGFALPGANPGTDAALSVPAYRHRGRRNMARRVSQTEHTTAADAAVFKTASRCPIARFQAESPASQVSINCNGEESLSGAILTASLTESLTPPRNAVVAVSTERRALGEGSGRAVPCRSFLNSGSISPKVPRDCSLLMCSCRTSPWPR